MQGGWTLCAGMYGSPGGCYRSVDGYSSIVARSVLFGHNGHVIGTPLLLADVTDGYYK